MEWVETTGKTVEEAKEAALDQLGVDERDAEFEVLAEPKGGLFGRLRAEARVRARVRPTQPRPKEQGRDRRRRGRDRDRDREARPAKPESDRGEDAGPRTAVATAPPRRGSRRENGQGDRKDAAANTRAQEAPEMSLSEQAEIGRGFLTGLVAQFSPEANVAVEPVDDDTIRLAVRGGDLGVLIGPKGQTLQAIQELVRTVVQRHTTSREGWLVVDVSDYRQKRKAALERFAEGVAAQVKENNEAVRLEPMAPADRKIVHDIINTIDGVTTRSEGEEPRRLVVIAPETGD